MVTFYISNIVSCTCLYVCVYIFVFVYMCMYISVYVCVLYMQYIGWVTHYVSSSRGKLKTFIFLI